MHRTAFLVTLLLTATAACGSDDTESADAEPVASADADPAPAETAAETAAETDGVRRVGADEAADLLADPPADLVVLDVRTPEEFAEAHIEGATMIDIQQSDFADRIAELDRDVPYFVYCRSGNRSAAATQLMTELGFGDITELDEGIVAWAAAGHPTVSG